jgi:hypothetical protein
LPLSQFCLRRPREAWKASHRHTRGVHFIAEIPSTAIDGLKHTWGRDRTGERLYPGRMDNCDSGGGQLVQEKEKKTCPTHVVGKSHAPDVREIFQQHGGGPFFFLSLPLAHPSFCSYSLLLSV